MRKFVAAIAATGFFMCTGCAWLGFGDDESATNVQTEPIAVAENSAQSNEGFVELGSEDTSAPKTKTKAARKGAKSEAQIKAELDQMGKKLVGQSARTLLPNKANKEVKQVGGQWVATYFNVDTQHVTTELRPTNNGLYVGLIRYQEEVMECRGATRQAALSAPCSKVRARNLTELIRYDGKAWQD